MTNYDLEAELKPALRSGEKLIWTGKPKTGIVFRSSDAFMIPFSLLWGGFAVFWELTVVALDTPLIFKISGIPFILIGLYMIVGRFFVDARKRANTIYGLTNDRILIKSGAISKSIKSLQIRSIVDVTLQQKADGIGTLTLGQIADTESIQGMESKQSPKLELIADVKDVYDKIIELQSKMG